MECQLKILLAGYGDIANRLTKKLSTKGIEPIAVKRTPLKKDSPVTLKRGDLRDADFVSTLLGDYYDVIVVSITPGEFSNQGYRESYVAVAKNLVSEINRAKVKPGLLLWVSSTRVYGEGKGEWVDEKPQPTPATFSGKRLLEAEQIISTLAVPYSILRFSGIYGPGRGRMLDQIKAGNVVAATPRVWSNRIHSQDCAAVLEHLIFLHQSGEPLQRLYLATDSNPTPVCEVQNWLAQQLGVVPTTEQASTARANRRCSNRLLLESGYEFEFASFREGYRDLIDAGIN